MVAVVLAGCGETTYFAGRVLPPSGLTRRVLIAIQNPSGFTKGGLEVVDAFYDTRYKYNNSSVTFSITGFSGLLPVSIQNMPEEQIGAVYSSGDGSLALVNYQKESAAGVVKGLSGTSSSIFISRNQVYVAAANQTAHVLTIVNQTNGSVVALGLPGVYRVSLNPGGSTVLAFVQNSNYVYYPRQLTGAQTISFSGGPTTWPKAAVDCEPQNGPKWCLFQAQSPDNVDNTGNYYGAPLTFDRPVKAVFSADGGTAYVLNCGPECGGTASSVTPLPISPMIFLLGQQSGKLPTPATLASSTIAVPGGASNALVNGTTLYVVGQQLLSDGLFTGNLSVLNLANSTVTSSSSISDGAPGGVSRMILADDNTLWIAMTKCSSGERYAKGLPYGCLTMYNTASDSVTTLEPFYGDATGIANVEGLHKIYTAQGGQVYIYSTTDGSAINNQYVTVTGTAWDVAYMDSITDSNNTVY